MNIRTPFINQYGRLRSGWRVLIFIFLLLVLINLVDLTLYGIRRSVGGAVPWPDSIEALLNRLFLLLSALAAGYLCTKGLESLSWRALGLTFHKLWYRDVIVGAVIGILTLAAAVAIGFAVGGLRFSMSTTGMLVATARSVGGSALLFAIAALAEEAIFRGYPLQTLSRARLVWLGLFLNFVFFAIVHLGNPNVVPGFTFANTALAGVWLAIAYIRTRSLWFPFAIHWGWNWALGALFGLPVSGLNLVSHPLIKGRDLGPAWITGGSYGIEGGVACTLVLILACVFVWRTKLISATPEMLTLTSQENPIPARTADQ